MAATAATSGDRRKGASLPTDAKSKDDSASPTSALLLTDSPREIQLSKGPRRPHVEKVEGREHHAETGELSITPRNENAKLGINRSAQSLGNPLPIEFQQ